MCVCVLYIGEVLPQHAMKAQRVSRGIALLFLDLGTSMGVGSQHHAPAALPPGKTRYPFCFNYNSILLVFYIVILIILVSSESKHLNSAVDFRNVSEHLGTVSVHNLNSVKKMLREAVFSVAHF